MISGKAAQMSQVRYLLCAYLDTLLVPVCTSVPVEGNSVVVSLRAGTESRYQGVMKAMLVMKTLYHNGSE